MAREEPGHQRFETAPWGKPGDQQSAFTDDELHNIISACDQLEPTSWSNGRYNGVWTGEDAKDFIWVLVYTGLRISDVALFNMSRLRGNALFLRAKKNGGDVFTWLPDWLRDRLVRRAKEHGVRPFLLGDSDRLETVTDGLAGKNHREFCGFLVGVDFIPDFHFGRRRPEHYTPSCVDCDQVIGNASPEAV